MNTSSLHRLAHRLALPALILLALVALASMAWARLTAPQGEQAVTFTPARQTCGTLDDLHYCINQPTGPSAPDRVYHLHGRGLDAEAWNDPSYFTAQVQGEWQRRGLPAPTVVTLSYGREWLLTPRGQAPRSGLLDRIGPQLDRLDAQLDARTGTPRRRMLVGESMGGLNVLTLGLSQPGRFDRIAALCPGVYQDSPFASLGTLRAALQRTGADPKVAFGVWWLARQHVADDAEWARTSPLALIETLARAPRRPALYLSCGLYDRYGNFEGTQALATRAQALGVDTEWHPLYGGHCAVDITSLARFLAVAG